MRRGARGNPVSLFSFQDVMVSTIGITLLLILILLLIAGQKAVQVVATETPKPKPQTHDRVTAPSPEAIDDPTKLHLELLTLEDRIVELERGRLTSWPGDYANYLRRREARQREEVRSNARFDKSLQERDARWGLRDISDLELTAGKYAMCLAEKLEVPRYSSEQPLLDEPMLSKAYLYPKLRLGSTPSSAPRRGRGRRTRRRSRCSRSTPPVRSSSSIATA